MAVAMVVAGGAFTGITFLANTLVDKLVPSNDGSNFGEETLNDSQLKMKRKITDQQHSSLTLWLWLWEQAIMELILVKKC